MMYHSWIGIQHSVKVCNINNMYGDIMEQQVAELNEKK